MSSGVAAVEEKYSSADRRWLRLKAASEENVKKAEDMERLFVAFEKHVAAVENELDLVDASTRSKIIIGTDSKKMNEEIERVKVA